MQREESEHTKEDATVGRGERERERLPDVPKCSQEVPKEITSSSPKDPSAIC